MFCPVDTLGTLRKPEKLYFWVGWTPHLDDPAFRSTLCAYALQSYSHLSERLSRLSHHIFDRLPSLPGSLKRVFVQHGSRIDSRPAPELRTVDDRERYARLFRATVDHVRGSVGGRWMYSACATPRQGGEIAAAIGASALTRFAQERLPGETLVGPAPHPSLLEPNVAYSPGVMKAFSQAWHQTHGKAAQALLRRPEYLVCCEQAIIDVLRMTPAGKRAEAAHIIAAAISGESARTLAKALKYTSDAQVRLLGKRMSHYLRRVHDQMFNEIARRGLMTPDLAEFLVVEWSIPPLVVREAAKVLRDLSRATSASQARARSAGLETCRS